MTDQELAEVDKQIEALSAKSQVASAYRTMCQTAGFQDLRRELELRMADLKNKWLTADDTEGAKIKIRGQVYNEVFDLIKSKILSGDMAARQVDELNARKRGEDQI